jgi:hypothetical protein
LVTAVAVRANAVQGRQMPLWNVVCFGDAYMREAIVKRRVTADLRDEFLSALECATGHGRVVISTIHSKDNANDVL